jgi:cytochrome c oxidase subunit 2
MNDSALQLFPDSASTIASRIDLLMFFLLAVSLFFVAIIVFFIVFFAYRYRRRSEDDMPAATEDHTWLEITWSVLPLSLLMVIFFWGASLFVDMKRPPLHALEINVIGKRWMWKIQHPGGQREIDELHIPVNTPVKLIMSSQDVIHSFYIPAFRIKQDVLPGSFTTQWFVATEPGIYHLFCAEYCGTLHSGMVGKVIAMSPQDYQAWLAGTAPDEPPTSAGAKLFMSYGCAQCHGQTGPTLAGLYGRSVPLNDGKTVIADEEYLRESILNPSAKIVAGYPQLMPSYRGQLTNEQVEQLIAYIKTLGAAVNEKRVSDSSLAPATQPTNAYPIDRLPNMPPSRRPPLSGLPLPEQQQ